MPSLVPEADQRAVAFRDLNQTFPLPRFESLQEWEARAHDLRAHLLAVTGLLPMPSPPPLRAEVFGASHHRDYSVSKVHFQSHSGLLVTGNLFLPRGKQGPFPAVLNPHGHWPEGRLVNHDRGAVLARGLTFARQGYVAFCYDMIGFNDSTQLPHREETDRQRLWGFSHMALQLYDSLRAVDFLQSLPIVDPDRIGCTGGSGGGTQTFMLMAVDPRIKVAAPVNMVSAHMQGGCVCENAPSLRLDTTNPEIAALMAPRPLLLVSATGDWTRDTLTVEHPFLRSIYALYDAADRVEAVQFEAEHNYNLDSRNAVYAFFARWLLGRDDPEAFREQPYRLRPKPKYLVFPGRRRPAQTPAGEKLLDRLIVNRRRQLRSLWPTDRRSLRRFQEEFRPALAHLLLANLPRPAEVQATVLEEKALEGSVLLDLVLTRPAVGDRVPAYLLRPRGPQRRLPATLLASHQGRRAFLDPSSGEPEPLLAGLLEAGHIVLLLDLFGTGDAPLPPDRDRRAAAVDHYLTYNRSDDANRIQDLLTGLAYVRTLRQVAAVNLVGTGLAGPWCLLARTQAPAVRRTVVDMARLRLHSDQTWLDQLLVPGLRGLGGLPTAAALIAPAPLFLYNLGAGFDVAAAQQAYDAAEDPRRLVVQRPALTPAQIVRCLA